MNDSFKSKYIKWFEENIFINDLSNDWKTFVTPFEDSFGDLIEFYYKKEDKHILLSDDGNTLFNLESHGVVFNTDSRKNIMNRLMLYHGIINNEDRLEKSCNFSNLPHEVHKYITGLISINDLHIMSKSNIAKLFKEDVQIFLKENKIPFVTNINVTGKSGHQYLMDFKFGEEKFIKTIGHLSKDKAMATAYLAGDTGLGELKRLSVIVDNTKEKPNKDLIRLMRSENINVYTWKERNDFIKEIA